MVTFILMNSIAFFYPQSHIYYKATNSAFKFEEKVLPFSVFYAILIKFFNACAAVAELAYAHV